MNNKGKASQNKAKVAQPPKGNTSSSQDKNKKSPQLKPSSNKKSPSPKLTECKEPTILKEPKELSKEDMDKVIAKQKEEQVMKKKEDEEQAKLDLLKKKKAEISERIAFEFDQRERLVDLKRKDLEKKENTINQMQETNSKLHLDLEYLQTEVQLKLNKFEFKAKNEEFEEERQKKEAPLEQLIKVKEKEINNALKIIANYKTSKEKFEKILREDKNFEQINQLNDESKILTQKIDELTKEVGYLSQIETKHKECEAKIEQDQLKKKEVKKSISEIKEEYKLKVKEERNVKGMIVNHQSERFNRTKEEKEALLKEKIDDYWRENNKIFNDETINQSVNKIYSTLNSQNNNSSTSKVKDWSRKVTNANMRIDQDTLPSLPLFHPEEKKILMDILPIKEIEKYEKRFECVDSVKAHLERKFVLDTHQLAKENKDIEHMYEYSSLQLRENEQKNKLLTLQINEQKKELKDLKDKINELMRQFEKTKEREKEKEMENKKLVKHLQELQDKYEKGEVNNEEEGEDNDDEQGDEGNEIEADYD